MLEAPYKRDAPMRVLSVGADASIEESVRSHLADDDVELVSTENRRDVLSRVATERVDCVVVSASQHRTGHELVASLRAEHERLPVVLFGCSHGDGMVRDALQAGATDYVPHETTANDLPLLVDRIRNRLTGVRERERADRFERRFRQTVERTTDAVYAVDTAWRIEYMNETMAKRVGRDPEAIVGTTLWEEFPSVTGTALEEKYRTAMETGLPVSFEQYLGEPFDYWVRLRAFPDADGLTVFSQEISDERARQRELERHERVLQGVHDAVFVVDDTLTVQFANAAAARALGHRSVARLRGESLTSIAEGMVSGADAQAFKRAVRNALSENGTEIRAVDELYSSDVRLSLDTPLGRQQYDVRFAPLARGDERNVLVVARDVTAQHAAERRIVDERDRLREVQRVVGDETLSSPDRIQSLLEIVTDSLGLEVGLVAAVNGDSYVVDSAYAPEMSLDPGDRFPLDATYCADVVGQDVVCSFVSATDAGKESHPAYRELNLEAYIGAPLSVDGERYGTLSFSSPHMRPEPFDDFEHTLVELTADLVGVELARDRWRTTLERQDFLFGRVQEIADIGIWEFDPKTETLQWSDGIRRIHGVDSRFEPTLADGIDFYHPDDRDSITTAVEQALEAGEPYDLDLRLVLADGGVRDVRAQGERVVDSEGQPTLRGVLQDITDRKRRERDLWRARQQFETFAEHVDQGLFLVPPDYSEVLYVNSAAEALYGVSEHVLHRRPNTWLDNVHPDDVETIQADVEAQTRNSADWPQVQRFRIQHPERGTRWLRSQISPIRDEHGTVVQLAGITADVTSFETYRHKLERLQRYTSQLVVVSDAAEAARIGVDAAIDVVGAEYCRIQLRPGAKDAETHGDELADDGTSTYDRAAAVEPLSAFARHATDAKDDQASDTQDDGHASSLMTDISLTVPLGEHGVMGVSKADAASFDEVDTTVLELLAEALSGALSRAVWTTLLQERERTLEAQNDRLEKFASIVSHDLRNPLGVANGYLQLAEESGMSDYFEKTAGALSRMEALIDDLLLLSKSGMGIENPSQCRLAASAHDAWTHVETKHATLRVDETVPTVEGDEGLLMELFENLFRNAVEHGGADVNVTVGQLTDRPGFYVADDGEGISPTKRSTVFDYGYTSSTDGTGFGLAIVREIATAHGWSVNLGGATSGGARFEFTLTGSGAGPAHGSTCVSTEDEGV